MLSLFATSHEYWLRIRFNSVLKWPNHEIRQQTRVGGVFPDGNSTLMLFCTRLRYVTGTQWGSKAYLNMKHLEALDGSETAVSQY